MKTANIAKSLTLAVAAAAVALGSAAPAGAAQTGTPSGMVGLERALTSGHKVIVSLNAELIWHQPVKQKDKNGRPESNHAVVVTGVDTVAGMVHLNDSGTAEGRNEQIPVQLFVESWDTSNESMVVTT